MVANKPGRHAFLRAIENGRLLRLARREANLPPKHVVELLERDESFRAAVVAAQRIAYEEVQEALYAAVATRNAAVARLWVEYHAAAEDKFERER